MGATIGLIVAGLVVLRCFEIWAVKPSHWSTPRLGHFMRIWAGITFMVTLVLASSLFVEGSASLISFVESVVRSRLTVQTFLVAGILVLIAYAWVKSRRARAKKLVARLQQQTVNEGIDLSRSLM